MDAQEFQTSSQGKTAKEAFANAISEAQYESGHGGYTGTIAEKHTFVMIVCPDGIVPHKYANQLLDDGDSRIEDKWGPAGCISLGSDKYLFFGWASS